MDYEATANELTDRVYALGPQILELDSAWDLLKIPEFECADLQPSAFQTQWALAQAKKRLRKDSDD